MIRLLGRYVILWTGSCERTSAATYAIKKEIEQAYCAVNSELNQLFNSINQV